MNIKILQTMISGIPLRLGLGTTMSDPYVYVASGAPIVEIQLPPKLLPTSSPSPGLGCVSSLRGAME